MVYSMIAMNSQMIAMNSQMIAMNSQMIAMNSQMYVVFQLAPASVLTPTAATSLMADMIKEGETNGKSGNYQSITTPQGQCVDLMLVYCWDSVAE